MRSQQTPSGPARRQRQRRVRVLSALAATAALGLAPAMGAAGITPAEPAAAAVTPAAAAAAPATATATPTSGSTLGVSETGRWIVQLEDPSLATYDGGIAGLTGTAPQATGADQLDVSTQASLAYADHLQTAQSQFAQRASQELGRDVSITRSYQAVLNAVVIEAEQAEATELAQLPGVKQVYPDEFRELTTDVSHDYIGSSAIWGGDTGSEVGTRGEGVLVGILDSGINPEHPSFAAVDGAGYQHENPLGEGEYLGVCDPTNSQQADEDICNDKLVGAWAFDYRSTSAIDADGHGSHTAATAVGNVHEATVNVGGSTFTRELSGVAPRANLIAYRVCLTNCPITAILAGINQAVTDGVDVINFSIAGSDDPWRDPISVGFLEAANAGVFVAAAAGNEGPGASTTAHTGPWVTAVAASTTDRVFAQTMDVLTAGAPDTLHDVAAIPSGDGPVLSETMAAPIRDAEAVDPGNSLGCAPFPSGVFDESIALVERGACNFSDKVDNATAAGAQAVVVFSDAAGPPTTMGGMSDTTVPAVMIAQDAGQQLRELLAGQDVEVQLNPETSILTDEAWGNVIAGFSSRGPSRYDLVSPTITAPGVNILAADAGAADAYMVQQGTSMASPHVAGAGALMTALHPDWTPMQIRSALAATATADVLGTGNGPASVFDQGSGLLNLDAAGRAGLVLDESYENFKAANPAPGFDGEPRTLNVPALVNQTCGSSCSWTRTVTNVADSTATYTATGHSEDGLTMEASPASITLAPGESATVEIAAQTGSATNGQWAMGSLTWSTSSTHAGGAPIADAHFPVVVMSADPQITVEPGQVEADQEVDTVTEHTVTIGNTGGQELTWSVVEDPAEQAVTLRPVAATSIAAAALPQDRTLAGDGATLSPQHNGASTATTQASAPSAGLTAAEGTVTMTHSESQEILANNTVACSTETGLTGDNGYLRTFTLEDFAITEEFAVNEVSFGIEAVNGAPTPLTVRLYTLDQEPLVYDNMTEIGNASVTLMPQTLQMTTVPVTGTVPAGATLVVELDAPDTSDVSGFYAGSNNAGESAPSYLRSVECGMPEPAPMAQLGFPDTHLVMNVTGTTEVPETELPDWLSVDPMSGSVPGGQSQEMTLRVDSTGLTPGETYGALVMLESNDPNQPTTQLPVTLSVTEEDGTEPPEGGQADQDIRATVPQDVGEGSLLISVDPQDRTVQLPEMTAAGDRLTTQGQLRPVTVTDSRESNPGWDASAQVSGFTATSGEGSFGGGFLGWDPQVTSSSDGQDVTAGAPVAPGFPTGEGLSVPRILATTDPGAGVGSAILGAGLDLQIPLDTAPGTYTAVLTITAL